MSVQAVVAALLTFVTRGLGTRRKQGCHVVSQSPDAYLRMTVKSSRARVWPVLAESTTDLGTALGFRQDLHAMQYTYAIGWRMKQSIAISARIGAPETVHALKL